MLVASVFGGNAYIASRHAAIAEVQGDDASTVALDYLNALADRDADGTAKLRATAFEAKPGNAPDEMLVGDATVAKALGMKVDFEILSANEHTTWGDPQPDRVNQTAVTYRATYTLTVEGKQVTASTVQGLLLERETFNGAGEKLDIPGPFSDGPVVFNNWLVYAFDVQSLGLSVPEGETIEPTSTYVPEGDTGYTYCGSPRVGFEEVSKTRVAIGHLPAPCFAGKGRLLTAEQADLDYVDANLGLQEADQTVDIVGQEFTNEAFLNPLGEVQFVAGDRTFIATYLMVDPSKAEFPFKEFRIIALTERG